jgi:iduronate 2-sulfatase
MSNSFEPGRSILSFGLALGMALALAFQAVAQDRPNVLFIAIDDLYPTLGCYGDQVMQANNGTPEIDSLADQGMTFLNHHVQWAVCGPSRAALTTGLMPDETGVIGFKAIRHPDRLPDVTFLPEHFRNHGYETACSGKFHDNRTVGDTTQPLNDKDQFPNGTQIDDPASWSIPFAGLGSGFSPAGKPAVNASDRPDSDYVDHDIMTAGLGLIDTLAAGDKPFFLAIGFKKPHLPFVAPKAYWDIHDANGDEDYTNDMPLAAFRTDPVNATSYMSSMLSYNNEFLGYEPFNVQGLPTDAQARELRHGYYACVSFIDHLVGQLLDKLSSTADPVQAGKMMSETTIVVLWGDHGFSLGEHNRWGKHTNSEISSRAPLIIYDPRDPANGITTEVPVSTIDIYPTLCELAELPIPSQPLSNTETVGRPLRGRSLAGLLDGSMEILSGGSLVHFNKDGASGYAFRSGRYCLIEWINSSDVVVARDLYDYRGGFTETVNLADEPAYAAVVHSLSVAMRAETSAQGIERLQNSSPFPAPVDRRLPSVGISPSSSSVIELTWPFTSGVSYRLMSADDPGGTWSEVAGSMVAGDLQLSIDSPKKFFEVEVDSNFAPHPKSDPLTGGDAYVGLAYVGDVSGDVLDPEQEGLTFSKVSGNTWLQVSAAGALSGTPAAGDVGANYFTLTATDSEGATETFKLQVTVRAEAILHNFQFADPDGTTLDGLVDSGGAASFTGSDAWVRTDSGELLISDADGEGNIFSSGTPTPIETNTGVFDLEFSILSADLTGSSNGANFGFGIRDDTQAVSSEKDIALVRIQHQGGELQLQSRMDGANETHYQFGTESIADVGVRARVTLNGSDPGLVELYLTIGAGSEQLVDSRALVGGKTLNALRFINSQSSSGSDVWGSLGTARIGFFRVTRIQ